MKIAIPEWQGRISPVFDVAGNVLLFESENGMEQLPEKATLTEKDPFKRTQRLRELGVKVLICGAVSQTLEISIASAGIQVIPYLCGRITDVIAAYLNGQLDNEAYHMPGCCGRRRGTCNGPGKNYRKN